MDKVRLLWRNPISTLTATSEAGNMLASRLLRDQIQRPWRSVGTGIQVLQGNLSSIASISSLCLYAHNLSFGATIRLELSLNGFVTTTFDQTWTALLPTYGFGLDPFGLVGFGGYDFDKRTPYSVFYFDKALGNRYKITITDPDNSDGYMQVGKVMLGDYWQPAYNVEYGGYARDRKNTSTVQQSLSGALFENKGVSYRTFELTFSKLSEFDELELDNLIETCKKSRYVLFSAYPNYTNKPVERLHTALCTIDSPSKFTRASFRFRTTSLILREAI